MSWKGNFAKGFVPDPIGHMTTSARRQLGLATPPPSGSVNEFAPPIRDQGQKGQCTGEGSMGALVTTCRAQGVALPFDVASPAWGYKIFRAIDREDPSIPLTDDGAMPNQIPRGVSEFGILPFSECSDLDKDVNVEPTILQLEGASRVHALGWRSIQSTGKDRVLDLMRAIGLSKLAVPCSSDVDQAFEDYLGKGTIPTPMSGPDLGGHFYYVTEYQTTTSGLILFRFRNSWTEDWGDRGTGWVDSSFVEKRLTSAFTITAQLQGAA